MSGSNTTATNLTNILNYQFNDGSAALRTGPVYYNVTAGDPRVWTNERTLDPTAGAARRPTLVGSTYVLQDADDQTWPYDTEVTNLDTLQIYFATPMSGVNYLALYNTDTTPTSQAEYNNQLIHFAPITTINADTGDQVNFNAGTFKIRRI
jgi:hypothetical protein